MSDRGRVSTAEVDAFLRLDAVQHVYTNPDASTRPVITIDVLTVARGEQMLLRGVSGSGKTTLFNLIAGLMRPTAGRITIDGTSIFDLPEVDRDRLRARLIGYMFQSHHLLGSMTALENVIMPMAFARLLPRSRWKAEAAALLDRLGLGDRLHDRPARLSTGQRLRVALARALANHPPIVLADEPTAALDTEAATTAMAVLRQRCSDDNAILIVASHDPTLAFTFTRVVDLRGGQLVGTPVLTPAQVEAAPA